MGAIDRHEYREAREKIQGRLDKLAEAAMPVSASAKSSASDDLENEGPELGETGSDDVVGIDWSR